MGDGMKPAFRLLAEGTLPLRKEHHQRQKLHPEARRAHLAGEIPRRLPLAGLAEIPAGRAWAAMTEAERRPLLAPGSRALRSRHPRSFPAVRVWSA